MAQWIRPLKSAVVIAEDFSKVNNTKDIMEIKESFQSWLQAWKVRDISSYSEFYDAHFVFEGKNKKKYLAHKKRVFQAYETMIVDMSLVRFISHNKYAITMMNQYFQGDKRFYSKGRKVLYWKKGQTGWKIFREKFDNYRFSLLSYDNNKVAKLGYKGSDLFPSTL